VIRTLKVFSLLVLFALALGACMQTENSNAIDDEKYGNITGTADYREARFILSQNCGNCHDYHTKTQAELESAGLIDYGNPLASQLYYRIRGSQGALGPKDMPESGSISAGDLNQIKIWIQNAN